MEKQRTTLVIRPAARGGKYLGHDAANADNHSALIALQELSTGRIVGHVLAVAATAASAGPPDLMAPLSRSAPYATAADTVAVSLSVDIDEPTAFRVLVFGPLKHRDQARLAQADITVLPGVDVGTSAADPEGLVIEVPGLCISEVVADWQGPVVSCSAMVTMMCGCVISNKPDWPWPYTDFNVTLVVCMASGAVLRYPLAFDQRSGRVSTFAGTWPSQAAPGDVARQVWVEASEPKLGNQGEYRVFPEVRHQWPRELESLFGLP